MGQRKPIANKTILIVEDEAILRFDLVDFFEHAGWRVFEATNAESAIELLDRHREIGAVLTDVNMPGSMDGLALAHHVRGRYPPTVLFVVSGRRPSGHLSSRAPRCVARKGTVPFPYRSTR